MIAAINHQQAKVITAMWAPAIQASLPTGYTCTKFQNGGGTWGISYYAHIYNTKDQNIATIRISDHGSNAYLTSGYICGSWDSIGNVIDNIRAAFAPKKTIEVELCGEFADEYSITKIHPDATNIRKGEFVRISKKSKRELFMFTFTKPKVVLA